MPMCFVKNPSMSRRTKRRAIFLTALLAALAVPAAPGHDACHAAVVAPASRSTPTCSEEVLYGRLVVTDIVVRSFVLLGLDEEFVAPDSVDLALLDGMLVRVDFDDDCKVRTVVPAEVLAGPMIET